jgi:hypothetical protein
VGGLALLSVPAPTWLVRQAPKRCAMGATAAAQPLCAAALCSLRVCTLNSSLFGVQVARPDVEVDRCRSLSSFLSFVWILLGRLLTTMFESGT